MNLTERIEDLRARVKTDAVYARLIEGQMQLFRDVVTVPGIAQPSDTVEWWHRTQGRLAGAAFFYAVTGDAYMATWLHDAALWVASQSLDTWIGPFFRTRALPLRGSLETAHLSNGIAMAYLFANDLFTEEEKTRLTDSLRNKAIPLLEQWLKPHLEGTAPTRNNWCIVEMDGVFAAAAALGEEALVRKYIPLLQDMYGDYNSEFYGEPAGYWNYSCQTFLNARFWFDTVFPHLNGELPDVNILLRPFLWDYYRRQGEFMLQNLEEKRFRNMTFGDQSTVGGFDMILLLYTSMYYEDEQVRSLAAGHFEHVLLESAGKTASLPVLCFFPYRGKGRIDESPFPPTRLFKDGFMMYKDSWENPKIQIAMQNGGVEQPRVISHRHGDQLSFQLAKDGIVILDDPGICCYRLHTSRLSKSAGWHSVPAFLTAGAKPELIEQITLQPHHVKTGEMNRRLYASVKKNAFAVRSEAREVYPEQITSLVRTFVGVGENLLVIEDRYSATEPLREQNTFLGNNRRRAMKWVFSEDGATLTREGVGVRIRAMQPVQCEMDYAALHDCTSPSPDSPLQGREGSGYLVRMQNREAAEQGRSVYAVFADRAENLDSWNATLDGDTLTVTQNGALRYTVTLGDFPAVIENGADLLAAEE